MAEITLTAENFEQEVIRAEKTVLVDFWASWCAPCMMLSPVIAEIAQEYGDTVTVGKVNVDEEPELAAQYQVSSIPTLFVIKDGQVVNQSLGAKPKAQILEML